MSLSHREFTRLAARWIFPLNLLLATQVAPPAIAQELVSISNPSFSVNGALLESHEFTGVCPVHLKFVWELTSSKSTTVRYTVRRSDFSSYTQSVNIPVANHPVRVIAERILGGPQVNNYHAWDELVLAPPNRGSNKILFTLNCQKHPTGKPPHP